MKTELEKTLARYGARYRLTRAGLAFQGVVFSAAAAAALYTIAEKLLFLDWPYGRIVAAIACTGLLTLLGAFLWIRVRPGWVGYLVDRQAGLKNLVCSAYSVRHQADDVAAVLVDRAGRALSTQRPGRLLPFRAHWTGRYTPLPLALLAATLFLPQQDVLGRRARAEQRAAERAEVREGALKLTARLEAVRSDSEHFLHTEDRNIVKDLDALTRDLADLDKQDALTKLGEFENQYRKDFARSRDLQEAARALRTAPDTRGLSDENSKNLKALLNALNQGQYRDAADAARRLAEALTDARLSPEEKKALARELAKLADALKGSGLSEALARQLADMAASTEDLESLLKGCEMAASELQEFARFCEGCQGLNAMKEGLGDAKKAMLGDAFSDFDAREVEQYMASQAQLGGSGAGLGTGGSGQGRGGLPLENRTETAFKPKLSPSQVGKGTVLQQLFVAGVPEKGEALVEYTDVLRSAREEAAGSLARETVPREYESMVKTYFDSLEVSPDNDASAP